MPSVATLAGVRVGDGYPVRLMAVLNVSPESFYSGSVRGDERSVEEAVRRAEAEGADFIDIGARSTAPYLETEIPVAEEIRRMTWALGIAARTATVPLSADTTRASVAAAALANGARVINDVSGLRADRAMADIAAQGEGVVLMASDSSDPMSDAPVEIVRRQFADSLARATDAGISPEEIVLDPGIGFFTRGPRPASVFNCAVLRQLEELCAFGRPLLLGVSRKSFLGQITGKRDPAERLWASLGATAIAVYKGAAVIRTHDVAATRDAVRVAEAIRQGEPASHGAL